MTGVTIELPPEVVAEVDRWAERLEQSRESALCQAVREWAARQQQEFEELLAEGYREMAPQLEQLAKDFELLQAAAAEEVWHWDE